MPRTFTLQRLFLAVTLCGVLLWFVLSFPYTTLGLLLFASWFIPSLVVSVFLSRFSSRRLVTVGLGMGAALLGFFGFLFPSLMLAGSNLWGTWWQVYFSNYGLFSLPAACCALVFGGATCMDHPR